MAISKIRPLHGRNGETILRTLYKRLDYGMNPKRRIRDGWLPRINAEIVRSINDRLCKERGYFVIEHPKEKGKSYKEWSAEKAVTSWKAKLRATIDAMLPSVKDFDDFLDRMRQTGYETKRNKFIAFRAPERMIFKIHFSNNLNSGSFGLFSLERYRPVFGFYLPNSF